MKLGAQQVQKMSHQLVMTPQLQQAIKLLQLSRFELEKLVEQSLVENPALDSDTTNVDESTDQQEKQPEIDAEAKTADEDQAETPEWEDELPIRSDDEWQEYSQSGAGVIKETSTREDDKHEGAEMRAAGVDSLHDYLAWQINVSGISEELKDIADYLLGTVNDDGYLTSSVQELILESKELQTIVKKYINSQAEEVKSAKIDEANFYIKYHEADAKQADDGAPAANNKKAPANIIELMTGLELAIYKLQELDPPGVFSRSLQECLITQLAGLFPEEKIAAEILQSNFNLLVKNELGRIAKIQKIELEQVFHAKNIITSLEPHPGRSFISDPVVYITPDVFVYKRDDEYVVRMNNERLPNLSINNHYKKLSDEMNKNFGRQKNKSDDDNVLANQYLLEKIRAAEWLIRSIEQRQKTILRVSESIVQKQQEFFEYGIEALKPMVLKDVAIDIGVHESTVSRITSNKYMHTPQGLFELKFFFTSGIKQNDGDFISSEKIKDLIQKMVNDENLKKPLTDSTLATRLETEMSIKVARRTVAKYREALNIAPSNQRKRKY